MTREQLFTIFNEQTTNGFPLTISEVKSQYGNDGLKIFSEWFIERRKQISYNLQTLAAK